METISRRTALGMAAGVIAGGVLAAEAAEVGQDAKHVAAAGTPSGADGKANLQAESPYKYRMAEAHARHYGQSSIREHKLHDFPMSSNMSASLIELYPGDVREPHWHPNSDEWLFVMDGEISMTIVDGKGQASQFTCGPEDVAFTPMGFGHYVESVGDKPAKLMLIHNHADFTTVNLTEWVAGGATGIFAMALNMPTQAFANAPTEKGFIVKKK